MRHPIVIASSLLLFSIATTTLADEQRPEHFSGESAETLEQAVSNFSEYNQRLNELLNQELTPERMAQTHELSYTLENGAGQDR